MSGMNMPARSDAIILAMSAASCQVYVRQHSECPLNSIHLGLLQQLHDLYLRIHFLMLLDLSHFRAHVLAEEHVGVLDARSRVLKGRRGPVDSVLRSAQSGWPRIFKINIIV